MSYFKTLATAFNQVIKSSKEKVDFTNLGYLPRWIIILFDVCICITSLVATKILITIVSKIDTQELFVLNLDDYLILGVNVVFFFFLRTYAGLIRHSSFIDAIKLFLASSATYCTLVIVNYAFVFLENKSITSLPKISIYFSLSFSSLFMLRLFVKQMYEAFLTLSNKEKIIKTFIYGVDDNAIAIANALKSEIPKRFNIIGFVNNDYKNQSKRILGLPIIFLKKNVSVIMRANGANALILADNTLTRDERLKIVDDCLDHNYKVFRAPIVSDLANEEGVTNQIQNIQIEDLLERDPIVLDNKLIAKDLFHKTVLVTGGAGSIGSEIIRQVGNYNIKRIIVIDQAETPLHQLNLELKGLFSEEVKLEFVVADVSNYNKMDKLFKKYRPNIIYHAAAYKHVPLMELNPSEAIFVNVMGSKNLADLSLKYDAEKFVMISTDKAVNPSNVMGASKRIAEMYVQSLHYYVNQSNAIKTKFITTRFGNVLGSNGSVVPLFKKQIMEGGPITITHPDIIRYFMTIPEACQLVLEAGAMGNGGEIFIFDMGKAVKILDLATKIIKLAGYIPYDDIDIKVIGLRPGEKLYEELLNDKTLTLPTYHEKIMIAKVEPCNFKRLEEEISMLTDYAKELNCHKIVNQMKVIVPEFKSMNSQFEALDSK